jgi:hypothetical protein
VVSGRRGIPAKKLADETLRAITFHCSANLLRGGNPQPRRRPWLVEQENRHGRAVKLAATIIDVLKIGPVPDVLPAPESLIRHACRPYGRTADRRSLEEVTGQFDETVSRLRPLARRRFNTIRPFLVRIRTRNPCVRRRRRLLG